MEESGDKFILLDAAVQEQRAQWLALWQAWPDRDVMAHPGYAGLFARPEDRTACACQIRRDGAILFPLILRPLHIEAWTGEDDDAIDLISPYGYGGPFGWGAYSSEAFWKGFDEWAHTAHAVSLFSRLSLFKEQMIPFYGDILVKGPAVIVSLEQSPNLLFKSYHKAVRENIRQAERSGVTVEVDLECRRLDDFLDVYYSTMDRLRALPMYYFSRLFFHRLIAGIPRQVVLVHAVHQGRVVSSELLLISEQYIYCFLGGTTEEGLRLRANPPLRHAVNLWGKRNDKRYVILGGGYAEGDRLLQYKQRFAPNKNVSFCVGTRTFDSPLYQELVFRRTAWEHRQGRTWWPKADFFPAYRG